VDQAEELIHHLLLVLLEIQDPQLLVKEMSEEGQQIIQDQILQARQAAEAEQDQLGEMVLAELAAEEDLVYLTLFLELLNFIQVEAAAEAELQEVLGGLLSVEVVLVGVEIIV
jgi:hypothetical protein